MSAYVVPHAHIEALVRVAVEGPIGARGDWSFYWTDSTKPGGYVFVDPEHGDEIGRLLLAENIRSVIYRYDDEPDEHEPASAYSFAYRGRQLTALEALVAIHGYEYQACEHPEWESSKARALCADLKSSLIRLVPGYDEAGTWTIDDYDQTSIPGGMAGAEYRRKSA